MQLEVSRNGEVLTVRVGEARLDAAVATPFKDAMRRAMQDGGETVLVDLSRVEFMDSSGLGAMIAIRKGLPPGRRLQLTGLSPNVERVFRLTRMDSVFSIHPPLGAGSAGVA